jgi:hypothetical protein
MKLGDPPKNSSTFVYAKTLGNFFVRTLWFSLTVKCFNMYICTCTMYID